MNRDARSPGSTRVPLGSGEGFAAQRDEEEVPLLLAMLVRFIEGGMRAALPKPALPAMPSAAFSTRRSTHRRQP